ncbi:MAG: hypothetical protein WA110_01155 [Anaerolineaceae bacterium]
MTLVQRGAEVLEPDRKVRVFAHLYPNQYRLPECTHAACSHGDYKMETYLEFTPVSNFQAAGLVVHLGDENHLALIRAHCGYIPPV